MLGSLGWEELLIVLVILALLFGASRVADLGGALGRGVREFRQAAGSNEPQPSEEQTAATAPNADASSSDRPSDPPAAR